MTDSTPIQQSYHDLQSLNQMREKAQHSQRDTLRAAVKEFEAYFINLMLKNMRAANKVIGEDNPLSSKDVEFFNEMHDQQLALDLSRSSSFGIGDILFKQLSANLPLENDQKSPKNVLSPSLKASSSKSQATQDLNSSEILSDLSKKSQTGLSGVTQPSRNDFQLNGKQEDRNEAFDAISIALKKLHSLNKEGSEFSRTLSSIDRKLASADTNTTEDKRTIEPFESKQSFIEAVKPYAIKAAKSLSVHPGVLIAQAALETGWGKYFSSDHQTISNNLFGIKADQRWQGERVQSQTLEFEDGIPVKKRQSFRAYSSFEDSFNDYVKFIQNNPRYEQAVEHAEDPKQYLQHIQKGGYATDPNYADKIHHIFIRESLNQITD